MAVFRNVSTGERLVIPADVWNALQDAARGNSTRNQIIQGLPLSFQFTQGDRNLVNVFNNSGSDIEAFAPIGLDDLTFTPGESPGDSEESAFIERNFAFVGVKPLVATHKIRFGVTQEPIPNQAVGIVAVDGLSIAKVDVDLGPSTPILNQDLPRVGIKNLNASELFPQPYGAEVLWIDETEIELESDKYWALVKLGRNQAISGIPGKAKAAIAALATGNIIETLADATPTEKGAQFTARNMGSAVALNDRIVWGVDRKGDAFFIAAESAAECGNGDCPDSCDPTTFCFEVFWAQGMASGSFFIEVDINRECMGFNDPVSNPNGFGSVTDPTTSRVWDLDVTWDLCLQSAFYIATDCANLPVNWQAGAEPISMGGTCPNQITITSINPVPGTCSGSSTFPCCDVSEGCTCL